MQFHQQNKEKEFNIWMASDKRKTQPKLPLYLQVEL